MRPVTINPSNPAAALAEIERASHENDIGEIAQNFTFDDPAFTQTFALLTGTPTLANTNKVLATLLLLMQKGGLHRTN